MIELKSIYLEIEKKIKDYQLNNFQLIEEQGFNPLPMNQRKIEALINSFQSQMTAEQLIRVKKEVLHLGPIEEIFYDKNINEIVINHPDQIYIEKNNQWQKHNDTFLSEQSFYNFVSKIAEESKAQVNLNQPCNNGNYKGCRVHVIIPPLSQQYPCISIRKHPKTPWTFEQLKKNNENASSLLSQIEKLVGMKKNILIVGPTGSGKTTLLNACLQSISTNERIISIEDTQELIMPHDLCTSLLTRHDLQSQLKDFNQEDLLFESLRMRPDRIVMGEIRGREAKDYLLALATGHKGCMATLHADDARQALWRLEMLVQMGAPQWSLDTIRRLIFLSIHAIVVLNHQSQQDGRSVKGVYQISSLEKFGFLIDPLNGNI